MSYQIHASVNALPDRKKYKQTQSFQSSNNKNQMNL